MLGELCGLCSCSSELRLQCRRGRHSPELLASPGPEMLASPPQLLASPQLPAQLRQRRPCRNDSMLPTGSVVGGLFR